MAGRIRLTPPREGWKLERHCLSSFRGLRRNHDIHWETFMRIHLPWPAHAMLFVILVASFPAQPVWAAHPVIDAFGVIRPGVGVYVDEFNDGIAPPLGGPTAVFDPGIPTAPYLLGPDDSHGGIRSPGFLPGAESGGVLHFAPYGLGVSCEKTSCLAEQNVTLMTDVEAGSHNGLGKFDDFYVYANWLLVRTDGSEYYRLRLSDGFKDASADDYFEIEAIQGHEHPWLRLGFLNRTSDMLSYTSPLAEIDNPHADHVLMEFTHHADDEFVTASYQLYNGTTALGSHQVLGALDLFHGEDFTRAGFGYVYILPEPGSVALMLGGLAILGIATRQRRPGTH